ncbi:hypothetical protein BCL93_104221 [Onishia taeanensis]|uniref:Uncharacterized protein n=1 Tax=Onishia taeanensis TaxID=284577 RepID=A0A328XVU0_9GAMM|nr:hypothetical protein BCL93_104221 [Halomonas taeanensis]
MCYSEESLAQLMLWYELECELYAPLNEEEKILEAA